MGNIADYMTPTEFNEPEPHWTDRHITPGYFAWDETGAYPIGCYPTKQAAKQALIDYAKTLEERNDQ